MTRLGSVPPPIHDAGTCHICALRAFRRSYRPDLPEEEKVALWAAAARLTPEDRADG